MKFTCEKAVLVSSISVASRTVAPKSNIPALEGIFVEASHNLKLTGYNLETGITVTVPSDIQEYGSCVLPARLFFDIIRKLPDDMVTITVEKNLQVSIRCGISSFTITATSGEDYPELPDVEQENGVSLPQGVLREMIGGTIFAVSENQARPIHTGCLFEIDQDTITVVAVDGFRLGLRTYKMEQSCERTLKFVVPSPALKELEKILTDGDENVTFILGPKHILFRAGDATLVCRLLEGEFLDYRRVVPTENPIMMTANVHDLTASIERVGLIISEKVKSPVRCLFGKNNGDFRTQTAIGKAHDVCDLAGDGQDLEIGFNCRYLLDALKAVPTEEVTLELSNGLGPILLTPAVGEKNYTYMVLPVRLNDKND